MKLPGQTFWLDIPNEPTPHLWIVLTDPGIDCVIVMLTDARNLLAPQFTIAAGTQFTPQVRTSKDSTVNFERARMCGYASLDQIFNRSGRDAGVCNAQLLSTIRAEL